jgi:hypothetical protein
MAFDPAHGEVASIQIEAIVIRADGSTEDLGQVAEWHRQDEGCEQADEETD